MVAQNRRRHATYLHSLFAVLAMVAQLVVSFAPLAESRDPRMASHVEAGGFQTHRAHSEAFCAACQARSIHGAASRAYPIALAEEAERPSVADAVDRIVSFELDPSTHPRAPPSVI